MNAIIMMHGLPGTGKSQLAKKVSENYPNSVILKTASLRKVINSSPQQFDESITKTRQEKDESYRLLMEKANECITEGQMPLLDATFHKRYRREWAYELAKQTRAKLVILSTYCKETTILERLKQRETQEGEDAILKTAESYQIMKSQQDELSNEKVAIKKINTEQTNISEVLKWLKNTLS